MQHYVGRYWIQGWCHILKMQSRKSVHAAPSQTLQIAWQTIWGLASGFHRARIFFYLPRIFRQYQKCLELVWISFSEVYNAPVGTIHRYLETRVVLFISRHQVFLLVRYLWLCFFADRLNIISSLLGRLFLSVYFLCPLPKAQHWFCFVFFFTLFFLLKM